MREQLKRKINHERCTRLAFYPWDAQANDAEPVLTLWQVHRKTAGLMPGHVVLQDNAGHSWLLECDEVLVMARDRYAYLRNQARDLALATIEDGPTKSYEEETVDIAMERSEQVQDQFVEEVRRLLRSGGIDPESHNRGMLFGVALENIADNFLRGERKSSSYKNLKRF